MKIYQSNLEGESRPIQWVIFQNSQVGTGRFESLSTKEESWSTIREQDMYLSRSDFQPLRSVTVQQRAEMPPEPGRSAQENVVGQTARSTDLQRASGASTQWRCKFDGDPSPAGLTLSCHVSILHVEVTPPTYLHEV